MYGGGVVCEEATSQFKRWTDGMRQSHDRMGYMYIEELGKLILAFVALYREEEDDLVKGGDGKSIDKRQATDANILIHGTSV